MNSFHAGPKRLTHLEEHDAQGVYVDLGGVFDAGRRLQFRSDIKRRPNTACCIKALAAGAILFVWYVVSAGPRQAEVADFWVAGAVYEDVVGLQVVSLNVRKDTDVNRTLRSLWMIP